MKDSKGLTILELLIVIAILTILALLAMPSVLLHQTRTKVAASRNNQRVLANAIETYRLDHGAYPVPTASLGDPFGIVSRHSLKCLTTPVAYASRDAFYDPFGRLRVQIPTAARRTALDDDPFRLPTPGYVVDGSSLYFQYSHLAASLLGSLPPAEGFAVVSVGPDFKDSFIVYYPFPDCLPPSAASFGILAAADSVYDPTNGILSGGDLAAFGGELPVARFVGGGN